MRSINFPHIDLSNNPTLGSTLKDALAFYQNFNQAKYYPREEEAKLKMLESKANLPFGGQMLPGAAGQVLALELMKNHYGEESPQYQQALRSFNLGQESTGSRVQYQNALTGSLPLRMLTPSGKSFVEESNVSQGRSPAGTMMGQPVSPGQAPFMMNDNSDELANQYRLERAKKNIPEFVKQKTLSAENIDKTLERINADDLTRYAGAEGAIKKALESAKAPFGKQSEQYDKNQEAIQNAMIFAKQVRQFYGDSIQPAMLEKLESISNPAFWGNNPKLAKNLFNQVVSLFKNETETYREAGRNPDIYTKRTSTVSKDKVKEAIKKEADNFKKDQQKAMKNLPEGRIDATANENGKQYVQINGKWYQT